MNYKRIITVTILIIILSGGSVYAYNAILDEIFDGNPYFIKGPATNQYNCLAYALGVTSKPIWPWETDSATFEQVEDFLITRGYVHSPTNVSNNKIIAFYAKGSTSKINHFAKINSNGTTFTSGSMTAKLGDMELVYNPNSHNPYKDVYGIIATKFKWLNIT